MARNWMEPPDWWVKYKPLRWVLAVLVLYWLSSQLFPLLSSDTDTPAEVVEAPTEPTAPAAEQPAPVAQAPKPEAPPTPPPPKPVEAPAPKPQAAPKPEPAPEPVPEPAPEPAAEPTPDPAAPYTAVADQRVTLINSFRSYDNVETLMASLEQGGYSATISTIERQAASSRHPPYRTDTLLVSEYRDGDFTGKLTLEFFNDRLYQAYFVPDKAAEYLDWLRRRGVKIPVKRAGRASLTQGDLHIATNIDFATSEVGTVMRSTPFILWEDTRLTQQMKDWGPVR